MSSKHDTNLNKDSRPPNQKQQRMFRRTHTHTCMYVWTCVHKHGHIQFIYYCEPLFYRYNSQSDAVMDHYTAFLYESTALALNDIVSYRETHYFTYENIVQHMTTFSATIRLQQYGSTEWRPCSQACIYYINQHSFFAIHGPSTCHTAKLNDGQTAN